MKLRSLAAIVCMLVAVPVQAARSAPPAPVDPDDAFVTARRAAIQQKDPARFELAAQRAGDHPLGAYLDYWRLRLRIADDDEPDASGTADGDIQRFLSRHDGTLVADLMRRDWLVNLGKRGDWPTFDAQYPRYVVRDEPAVACYALAARRQRGENVAAEARDLLLRPRGLDDACGELFESLLQAGVFGAPDLQRRLRLDIEANSTDGLRRLAPWLARPIEPRTLDAALSRPQMALSTGLAAGSTEATLIALARLARNDPGAAADWLEADASLRGADRAFAYSQVAAAGQRKLLNAALDWVRQSGGAGASDDTLAWHARSALQAQDWKLLRAVLDQMSEAARREPTWVYWQGRVLRAEGRTAEAESLWKTIAGQPHFYGQLAAEEIGAARPVPPQAAAPTQAELAEAARRPGFQRARLFYDLGLRFEGNREWNFALRGLDDRQLLAAAEWARSQAMLDRAVNTADRTRAEHDYTLRFPTPYRDELVAAARERDLDPAWVYGLIRQESRFIMDARSGAGAHGLMQIMPATGRWIARKLGMTGFRPSQLGELDTNLTFGTFYLKKVLDDLDGSPLLASAAYNAGPGRPRAWRAQLPRAIDGASFAEIVPFEETRTYVKNVLSNSVIYATLFTGRPQSLKSRLGTVQPTSFSPSELP